MNNARTQQQNLNVYIERQERIELTTSERQRIEAERRQQQEGEFRLLVGAEQMLQQQGR